ncbi:MAG: Holliday junction resolvase RuvX [Janthinobacterium lividum]
MSSRRTLALDVGDRRIGLAITDALGFTAQPLFTVHRTTMRADLKAIGRFIRKHEVATLVVGRPLHADGAPSPQSVKTEAFAAELFAEHPALAHHLIDERLTTKEAHVLLDAGGGRHRAADRISRKEMIDQVAATLILEAFLSLQNGPALLPDPDGEVEDDRQDVR